MPVLVQRALPASGARSESEWRQRSRPRASALTAAHWQTGGVVWHLVHTLLFRSFIFWHVGELPKPMG